MWKGREDRVAEEKNSHRGRERRKERQERKERGGRGMRERGRAGSEANHLSCEEHVAAA